MSRFIKFRHVTKAQWTGLVKDAETLYLMTDTKEVALGAYLFYTGTLLEPSYNASNGVITFPRVNAPDATLDLPTELIFDGEQSFYDHETKELVLVFANSSGEVRIDFGDLAQKILDKVDDLKTDLENGVVVVELANRAEKDINGAVIHTTYATNVRVDGVETVLSDFITLIENTYYNALEVEQRIKDLALKFGLEDSAVEKSEGVFLFNNGDDIDFAKVEDFVFVLTRFKRDDSVVANSTFQPSLVEQDDLSRVLIKRNPPRWAELKKNNGAIEFRIKDDQNITQTDTPTTLRMTGFRLKEVMRLGIDNQDANRIDFFKLAIIDGKLAYEIEEGE